MESWELKQRVHDAIEEYYDSPQLEKEEKLINVRIYEQSTGVEIP